jgi:hypothetical protein
MQRTMRPSPDVQAKVTSNAAAVAKSPADRRVSGVQKAQPPELRAHVGRAVLFLVVASILAIHSHSRRPPVRVEDEAVEELRPCAIHCRH